MLRWLRRSGLPIYAMSRYVLYEYFCINLKTLLLSNKIGTEYECSGHGVCKRLDNIARNDYLSSYKLWGKDVIKGML